MAKIIGVDLGTTNSEAAYLEAGRPKIIPSAEGSTFGGKMFPSVVAFTEDGERVIGEPAKRQAVLNPERTVTRIKRKMGTDHKVKIDDKEFTPQQISAMILQKIKTDAEEFLGEEVKQAVITVPAYFNDNQRTATKDAGEIAGLEVLRLINEPTAASLAYGLDKAEEQRLLVLDLGGGTFDVTVMEIGDGVFEVVSTSGDTQLGGTDMDDEIIDWVLDGFKKQEGIDLSEDKNALQRVRDACERAKIELSSTLTTTINLPFIAQKDDKPRHLEIKLTRAKLEELVEPVLKRCEAPIRQALKDSKLSPEEIGKIILVGGPTRMPIVREWFEKILGKKAERGVDPMQCVAMGAAIQAGVLAGEVKDLVLLDVTPLSLGLETLGAVTTRLVERNTTIPTKKTQVFTTAADGQTSVEIHVLQGEREMAADNTTLGRFHLIGIPPAPRGIPQVEVSFDIDANGILNVSAKDLGTGKEQKITITASTKLSHEKIDEATKEAEKYAEEDAKKRVAVEARNQADSLVYSTEKTLKEMGDKLSDDTKNAVQAAVDDLKKALEGDDVSEIKAKTEKLIEESQKIGSEIYQQAQAQQAAAQAPPAEEEKKEDKDNVVDADYKVVDEE
ncbi:MAG: molecular chaperone DnaK [Thermoplasmata archaeon]|nr:molecular chaperone DnaK [Candidatus Thermoplasmatota archaeon]MCK4948817.1 molecular chaperone DnaK [Thermoplasmata archaeon]